MQEFKARISKLTALWGGVLPVMNSPMAGITTPEMVAAVSNAGGLGVLAGDFLEPDALKTAVEQTRELTDKPFAVNLRVRDKEGKSQFFDNDQERAKAQAVRHALGDLAVDLGLPEDYAPAELPDFEAQLESVLDLNVGHVCVGFGGLREIYAEKLEKAGVVMIGAATTLREVKVMRSAGVNAVVVQGMEAGGPRLNFEAPDDRSLVGLMNLIGPATRASGLPVVASGGIMTGRQLAASLVAGASGAMIGTALLKTPESAAHPAHKEALSFTGDNATVLTRLYDGRLARIVDNAFVGAIEDAGLELAAYPNQWKVMQPLANAARACDRDDLMPMYAGQGADLAQSAATEVVIARLMRETEQALETQLF
ncbi:MAG: nitronate monooxygenase [Sutterellaceae bacterium]|nr:nitronate monooxygenase [Sutterellaceae bacterium]